MVAILSPVQTLPTFYKEPPTELVPAVLKGQLGIFSKRQ